MPQLGLLYLLVFLPMNMLSGNNTPLESMPPWLATIMQASPSTHFVSLAQAILYRGAGFAVIWLQFVIVGLIGGLFLGLALLRFRGSRVRLPSAGAHKVAAVISRRNAASHSADQLVGATALTVVTGFSDAVSACGGVWRYSRQPTAVAAWRVSMSSNIILAGAAELRRRMSNGDQPAREMRCWELRLRGHWSDLRIGATTVWRDGPTWLFSLPVDLRGIAPGDVAVQLYAEPLNGGQPFVDELSTTPSNPGIYIGSAPASRPAEEYTVRIIPRHTGAAVPAELPLILWRK